jgi:hypothetical protein
MASPGGTLKPRRRGWACFRLSNGPVFDCQGSGEMSQVGLFSFVNWACFRLTKVRQEAVSCNGKMYRERREESGNDNYPPTTPRR